MSRRVFLGMGSNLGDRHQLISRAVAEMPGVVAVSALYETDPVGGPPGQGRYLNAVVELRSDLCPRQLLELARALEEEAGRERYERWGPRTLDVDVLMVGDLRVDEVDLVVPHPMIHMRAFVLVPLAELAPEVADRLAGPGWRQRVEGVCALVAQAVPGTPAKAPEIRVPWLDERTVLPSRQTATLEGPTWS